MLQPYPEPHSVVIMDNCRIHHKQLLQAYCDSMNVMLVFLPAYSPELNPIEQLFSKIKQWMRANRDTAVVLAAS